MVCTTYRLSHYGGVPVHISAYILDTDHSGPPAPPCQHNDGTESDSGISDTNHDSDQESNSEHDDTEKEKTGDDGDMEVDMECETILTNLADPTDVLGLEAIVGLTPPPEDQEDMLAYTAGQDALEAELVHIDEQLMHIEDDLGHIDEQFIMMDQQLAETISDESMYETDNMYNNAIAATEVDLDTIDIVGNNPFDDWQREALSDLNDLVLDNEVQTEVLSVAAPRNIESEVESQARTVEDKKEEEILHDPDLFPTDQTQSGSALLEDFDEDLLESKLIRSDLDKIVKQDVVLPQMSSLQNSSAPYRSVAPASLLDHPSYSEQTDNLTQTAASSKESSVDRDLMEEINVEVDQDDEDIIMQVLRESNINFDEIPIDIEGLKVEEEIKLEDIKEEVVEVEDIGYQISIVDGAAAKAEIDYDQLHSDIKAKFQEADDGYSFAELTLGSQFSDAYNPGFNSRAFENDHSYGVTTKLEPSGLLEPTTSRRRNVSESSGYSSMTEDLSSSRCRDEIKAKKLKLPFLVHDIINSPVDLFNEMLLRPGLSSEQLQLCKDIRRRGKNKVAAQNCRKRKMDTIEELQHQVDQVSFRLGINSRNISTSTTPGEETQRTVTESSRGVGGREGQVEQQAQLPGGERPSRHREGAGDVHPGGEGQHGGSDQHGQPPHRRGSREVPQPVSELSTSLLLRTAFALSSGQSSSGS